MNSKVGVIGCGRMGLPICGHLVRGGFTVVGSDVDTSRRSAVEGVGADWADSVAELGRDCEFVLLCVGFEDEIRDVVFGAGLAAAMRPDSVLVVLSTVSPQAVRDWAAMLSEQGVHVVDASVCRGGWAAEEGTLLSFVGGAADVFARIEPVVRTYSSDVVHSGEVGTGQVCKAVNNMILWACLVADHEGLALARRYGIDSEVLRTALQTSTSANRALEQWGRQTMAWAQDDMAIVMGMADECGVSLPQAGVTREICRTLKPRRFDLARYGA